MRLAERVAIVTGAGNGIAKAIAIGLAREGAKVVIAEHQFDAAQETEREISKSGGVAKAILTDVSSEESTQGMVKQTADAFGKIDILFNVAAHPPLPRKQWYELSVEEWSKPINVDLLGCFLCSKAVFPYMRSQGSGRIINFSSSTVVSVPGTLGVLPYVTAKAAVIGFTRTLARHVGDHGINVNTLMPGSTLTERVKRRASKDYIDSYTAQRCLKRPGQPEDLVGTAIFLSSDDSRFITGQTILVDGGRGML
jgi:3-oxoacyl-[acyl-carrier protein] reductase